MFKKWTRIISLILITLLLGTAPVMAAPTVYMDGQQMSFDVPPTIENDRTLVPMSAIFTALGAQISWNGDTSTVTAVKGDTSIVLQIGNIIAYKNGQPITLDVPPKTISERTMVPLTFVGTALGADVQWVEATQTIYITSASGQQIKVHFIDVGQADSIYIQLPDHNDILIDAGNVADGPTVVNYLKNQGVDDLELMIATHPHEDHIGGLPDVLGAFTVDEIIDSGKTATSNIYNTYSAAAQAEGCAWLSDNYQVFNYGNVALQILTGNQSWGDEINDYSVVSRLDCGNIEFLFEGDAETPVESILPGDISADILKVGHHGSGSSSSQSFLSRVAPKTAIICVGTGNTYGHPATVTLNNLQSAGATIYRTDLNGTVVVTTDGNTYSILTQKNDTTSPIVQPDEPEPSDAGDSITIKYIDLQQEIVTIKNESTSPVDMTGWYLVSETGNQTYYFPSGYTLAGGAIVYITSGSSAQDDGANYLMWSGSYIWNNDGDPGVLYNYSGQLVSQWP